jgi:hypothetical protein
MMMMMMMMMHDDDDDDLHSQPAGDASYYAAGDMTVRLAVLTVDRRVAKCVLTVDRR